MPRPRRFYQSKKAYFASARLSEGLPFVPNKLINAIILGILADAQNRYRIKICAFVFMQNHFHLIFIPLDAIDAKEFFRYFKGEVARAIRKLTGSNGAIWQGRTDTPILLDNETIIDKLSYIYLNPIEANLVIQIGEYPGLSSWQALKKGKVEIKAKRYYIRELKKLNAEDGGRSALRLLNRLMTEDLKKGEEELDEFEEKN